jgi:alkylation response protein AidB-like acyl-CoA dehydrogenase
MVQSPSTWANQIAVTQPCQVSSRARCAVALGAELVPTSSCLAGRLPAETARASTSFTIFEGTSEIQRMIIGSAVIGLDVR